MHIALFNSFPNQVHTAEVEYIARFKRAAERIGHTASEVITSDQVYACDPDFVIATHFFTPKLTPHLTLGTLWNPPQFFDFNRDFLHAILSYDGYLIGSESIRAFASRLDADHGVIHPASDFHFLPVSPSRALAPSPPRPRDLVYVGTQWDGPRHGSLFSLLDQSPFLNVYGPKAGWTHCAGSYRGQVPFDGDSLFHTLSRHGIALCFHKEQHRMADTPSARIFEAAAAGCLLITDTIPFAGRVLGESIFQIDLTRPAEECAVEIIDRVLWARAHPEEAAAMAHTSHAVLAGEYSLERAVEQCCAFASSLRNNTTASRRSTASAFRPDAEMPNVDILLPLNGRPPAAAAALLRSIAAQDQGLYRVLLIGSEHGLGGDQEDVAPFRVEALSIAGKEGEDEMSAGLARVTAPFFAILDIDDRLAPNHFGSLFDLASRHPEIDLFWSSLVAIDDADPVKHRPNFEGPLGLAIPERRVLVVPGAAVAKEGGRTSGAWIARRHLRDIAVTPTEPETDLDDRFSNWTNKALSYRPTLHRARPHTDEAVDRSAPGRAIVDGQAEILALKRALFDAGQRAANAKHEAARLQASAHDGRKTLDMIRDWLQIAEGDVKSLGRSRVLSAVDWVSPKPLAAVRRLAAALAEAHRLLAASVSPGDTAPSDRPNRFDAS